MAVGRDGKVLVGDETGNINRRLIVESLYYQLRKFWFYFKGRDIADFEAENHTWRRLTWQWCANEFPVEEARSRETLKRPM